MKYTIKIKKSAEKELNVLPLKIYKQIASHIFMLENNPRPLNSAKLKDNVYRIRVGDYRIVYLIDDKNKIIEIIKLGHRKEVYRVL
jgi:mRNA interferase RelE/StbE